MGLRIMRALTCVATAVVFAASAGTAGAQSAGAQSAAASSDVGPASLSDTAGDPNLGLANQPGRTVNFDDGWRFKLVNTADTTDPSAEARHDQRGPARPEHGQPCDLRALDRGRHVSVPIAAWTASTSTPERTSSSTAASSGAR